VVDRFLTPTIYLAVSSYLTNQQIRSRGRGSLGRARAGESHHEPVPQALHFLAAGLAHGLAQRREVRPAQILGRVVPQPVEQFGGADDVGEKQRYDPAADTPGLGHRPILAVRWGVVVWRSARSNLPGSAGDLAPIGSKTIFETRRNPMSFDPVQYKTTTRQQWEDASEAWHRWGPTLEDWLGQATERMLNAAGVVPGARVLDVAAGAGGQTLAAARLVGAGGSVVATDISPTILTYAARAAVEAGLTNVETIEADGEALYSLPAGSFDAVICRLGLIYFPDQQRALAGIRRALRDGGRLAAIVFSTPQRNEFFSIPVSIVRDRAQLPPPEPGQPGPFSLGGPGVLQAALSTAGLSDVTVDAVASPVRLPSAAECVRFERESFGALHQMLAGVAADERPAVWDQIEAALTRFETPGGFVGPCELLVGVGTK